MAHGDSVGFRIKGTLTGIFAVVAAVGAMRYGIDGINGHADFLNSVNVGFTAGFGALLYDIFRHFRP
jgi:hypothetical protein